MSKKLYVSPQMKVVKVDVQQMLCQSFGNSQNESYEEVSEETTNSWFN